MKTISLLTKNVASCCKMCNSKPNRLKYITEYDCETNVFVVLGFCSDQCKSDYKLMKVIDEMVS